MWQGAGVGGGTASATVRVFFARMRLVVQWQGGGCGNAVSLAATTTRDKSRH